MARNRSYWPVVRYLRDKYGLTLGEARSGWRVLRDRFEGDRPTVAELRRHSVIGASIARELVVRRADVFEKPPADVEKPTGLVRAATEEWHVSVTRKGYEEDLAISVIGPAGATADQIKAVIWRGLLNKPLDTFKIAGVDWTDRKGRPRQYAVGDLPSFKHFAGKTRHGLGATWRIALLGE